MCFPLNCRPAENRRSTVLQFGIDAPCVGAHPNAPVPLSENEFTGISDLARSFSIFVQN
ncbi:homocysteine S-methyltransferase family protein [Pseudomonas sp. ATCC 43928]|nr:homocysteine S-methyltransferase family protein [Pseudomonas sp. ATCC 43928]